MKLLLSMEPWKVSEFIIINDLATFSVIKTPKVMSCNKSHCKSSDSGNDSISNETSKSGHTVGCLFIFENSYLFTERKNSTRDIVISYFSQMWTQHLCTCMCMVRSIRHVIFWIYKQKWQFQSEKFDYLHTRGRESTALLSLDMSFDIWSNVTQTQFFNREVIGRK